MELRHSVLPGAPLLILGIAVLTSATRLNASIQGQTTTQSSKDSANTSEQVGAWLREAASLLQLGKEKEAEPILQRVIAVAPRNSDAHNLLRIIFDRRRQFKAAEEQYRLAMRLNPTAVSPVANLGVLLGRTNRSDEAIKMFETVLQRVPNHPEATPNLGVQYVARGDYARRLSLLQRSVQQRPETMNRHSTGN